MVEYSGLLFRVALVSGCSGPPFPARQGLRAFVGSFDCSPLRDGLVSTLHSCNNPIPVCAKARHSHSFRSRLSSIYTYPCRHEPLYSWPYLALEVTPCQDQAIDLAISVPISPTSEMFRSSSYFKRAGS